MALYRIAGLLTELDPKFGRLAEAAEKYRADGGGEPDIRAVLPEKILERKAAEFPEMSLESIEYFYTGVLFSYRLFDFDAAVVHGSAVSLNGKAYVFSADSGTGKSTHTSYWKSVFGDRAVIVNDDKPAIRYENGVFNVYGTPFSGKETLNENVSFPLGALCFLYRSEMNEIKRITPEEALPLILKQSLRPNDPGRIGKLLSFTDKLLENTPLFLFGASNDPSSAVFAEKELSLLSN